MRQRKDHTEVIASYPLTADELKEYRTSFRVNQAMTNQIAIICRAMAEAQIEEADELWNDLAAKCGYANADAVHDAGYELKVNRSASAVQLMGKMTNAAVSGVGDERR